MYKNSFINIMQSYGVLTGISPKNRSNTFTETRLDTPSTPWSKATLKSFDISLWKKWRKNGAIREFYPYKEPVKSFSWSLLNLPNPGAFKSAAIALRVLIHETRRLNETPREHLAVLYDLAALESFLHAFPFDPEAKIPSRHVFKFIQPEQWERILQYEYETLGYEQLTLLNKTDRASIKAVWGEPNAHTTLRALNETEWREAVQRHLRREWEREIEIPSDLSAEEFELHYSGFQPPTFEEYIEMGRKNWEKLVEQNDKELGSLDKNDKKRKDWEKFKELLKKNSV
jgi:hypothetical protein